MSVDKWAFAATTSSGNVNWTELSKAGGDTNTGVWIAQVHQKDHVRFLLIQIAANGYLATHAEAGSCICYVSSGSGTIEFPDRPAESYAAGQTVYFAPSVQHAWRNTGEPALIAVTIID